MTKSSEKLPERRFAGGDPMRVIGLSRHYSDATRDRIPRQWDDLQQRLADLEGRIDPARFGIVYTGDEGTMAFEYLTAVLVGEEASVPDGMVERRVPARRHAVFTHRGAPSGLPPLMHRVFTEWLPQSGEKAAGEPSPLLVEVYEETYDPASADSVLEVWIPVKDR